MGHGPLQNFDKAVTSRVPTRPTPTTATLATASSTCPLHGYARMFENMLDHRNIKIMVNVDFREIEHEVRYDR